MGKRSPLAPKIQNGGGSPCVHMKYNIRKTNKGLPRGRTTPKTQIKHRIHFVLNCDHLKKRNGWSGENNDVKGSMAMSWGLQSGVQHCRCRGYLCCSLYCSRRYLANGGIVSVSSKRCPSLQWESRQKAALPSVVESSSSTGRGGRWSSIFISATKNSSQRPFPKNCGALTFCPAASLFNGEGKKLLNVDSNYLLIWLIAPGRCSNYPAGKKCDKKLNFWAAAE